MELIWLLNRLFISSYLKTYAAINSQGVIFFNTFFKLSRAIAVS